MSSKSTSTKTATPRVRKSKSVASKPAAEATVPVDPAATTHVEAVPPVVARKRTIEKDREERNGVKRPSAGGACRAVWDFCDAAGMPTVAQVKAEAEARGWNANNASIEYYQWRKFMGIRGRQGKPVATDSVAPAE